MSKNENISIKDVDNGVEMVLTAFNQQKIQFIKIINSLKEKIIILENQIIKLKNENILYKNKINSIQKKIRHISTSIYELKDDDNFNTNKNNTKENNLISEVKHNIRSKTSKQKHNAKEKRHSLNKNQLKKLLYQNYKSLNNFSDRNDIDGIDIIIKNRNGRNIKNNILQNLYNKKK